MGNLCSTTQNDIVTMKVVREEIEEDTVRLAMHTNEEAVMDIAKNADFSELNVGYTYSYEVNNHGVREGKTDWVQMDQPRLCSYRKYNKSTFTYDSILLQGPSPSNGSSIPLAEYRGITLRQLRAVVANIQRRCVPEGWKNEEGKLLTPETVSFHHANKYVIKPFTVETKKSFITSLPSTAGPQPPRFYVSHWLGQPVKECVSSIEQFFIDFMENNNDETDRRGGGMREDTPIWICAFANNQWVLGEDTREDAKELSFTRAMKIADNRTITILDKNGIIFSRIWCIYELYLALIGHWQGTNTEGFQGGVWAVYTTYRHTYENPLGNKKEVREALGIIFGGAPSDQGSTEYTTARQCSFPFDLIMKSLRIRVEDAEASKESDRIHILNSIIGKLEGGINDPPPKDHERYIALNNALRGTFASSPETLIAALKKGDMEWKEILTVLSKVTVKGTMKFDFNPCGDWRELNLAQATRLILHLPLTIEGLTIEKAPFGIEFMKILIQQIKTFTNLKSLRISHTLVGGMNEGRDSGLHLAEAIASNSKIEKLNLYKTDLIGVRNVALWADVLAKNKVLKSLKCSGMDEELKKIDSAAWPAYEHSTHNNSNYNGQIVYCACGIFPDAMLTDEGYKVLAKGIALNTSLETIYLMDHGASNKVIVEVIGKVLQENKTITKVNISEESDKEGVEHAVQELQGIFKDRLPKLQITNITYKP